MIVLYYFVLFAVNKFLVKGATIRNGGMKYIPSPYFGSLGDFAIKDMESLKVISYDPFIISFEFPDGKRSINDQVNQGIKRKKPLKKRIREKRDVTYEKRKTGGREKRCHRSRQYVQNKRELQSAALGRIKPNMQIRNKTAESKPNLRDLRDTGMDNETNNGYSNEELVTMDLPDNSSEIVRTINEEYNSTEEDKKYNSGYTEDESLDDMKKDPKITSVYTEDESLEDMKKDIKSLRKKLEDKVSFVINLEKFIEEMEKVEKVGENGDENEEKCEDIEIESSVNGNELNAAETDPTENGTAEKTSQDTEGGENFLVEDIKDIKVEEKFKLLQDIKSRLNDNAEKAENETVSENSAGEKSIQEISSGNLTQIADSLTLSKENSSENVTSQESLSKESLTENVTTVEDLSKELENLTGNVTSQEMSTEESNENGASAENFSKENSIIDEESLSKENLSNEKSNDNVTENASWPDNLSAENSTENVNNIETLSKETITETTTIPENLSGKKWNENETEIELTQESLNQNSSSENVTSIEVLSEESEESTENVRSLENSSTKSPAEEVTSQESEDKSIENVTENVPILDGFTESTKNPIEEPTNQESEDKSTENVTESVSTKYSLSEEKSTENVTNSETLSKENSLENMTEEISEEEQTMENAISSENITDNANIQNLSENESPENVTTLSEEVGNSTENAFSQESTSEESYENATSKENLIDHNNHSSETSGYDSRLTEKYDLPQGLYEKSLQKWSSSPVLDLLNLSEEIPYIYKLLKDDETKAEENAETKEVEDSESAEDKNSGKDKNFEIDISEDKKLIEEKMKYLKDILAGEGNLEKSDTSRKKRSIEFEPEEDKLTRIFRMICNVKGKKCAWNSDKDRVASQNSNQERYEVKKWIDNLKMKRSRSKCDCENPSKCDNCQHCSRCARYCRRRGLLKNVDDLEDNLQSLKGIQRKPKEEGNGPIDPGNSDEKEEYTETNFHQLTPTKSRSNLIPTNENPEEKLLRWTKRSKSKISDPLLQDLTLYRDRAKEILKNAEEILRRIHETENNLFGESNENVESENRGKDIDDSALRELQLWKDQLIEKRTKQIMGNEPYDKDLVLELIKKVADRLPEEGNYKPKAIKLLQDDSGYQEYSEEVSNRKHEISQESLQQLIEKLKAQASLPNNDYIIELSEESQNPIRNSLPEDPVGNESFFNKRLKSAYKPEKRIDDINSEEWGKIFKNRKPSSQLKESISGKSHKEKDGITSNYSRNQQSEDSIEGPIEQSSDETEDEENQESLKNVKEPKKVNPSNFDKYSLVNSEKDKGKDQAREHQANEVLENDEGNGNIQQTARDLNNLQNQFSLEAAQHTPDEEDDRRIQKSEGNTNNQQNQSHSRKAQQTPTTPNKQNQNYGINGNPGLKNLRHEVVTSQEKILKTQPDENNQGILEALHEEATLEDVNESESMWDHKLPKINENRVQNLEGAREITEHQKKEQPLGNAHAIPQQSHDFKTDEKEYSQESKQEEDYSIEEHPRKVPGSLKNIMNIYDFNQVLKAEQENVEESNENQNPFHSSRTNHNGNVDHYGKEGKESETTANETQNKRKMEELKRNLGSNKDAEEEEESGTQKLQNKHLINASSGQHQNHQDSVEKSQQNPENNTNGKTSHESFNNGGQHDQVLQLGEHDDAAHLNDLTSGRNSNATSHHEDSERRTDARSEHGHEKNWEKLQKPFMNANGKEKGIEFHKESPTMKILNNHQNNYEEKLKNQQTAQGSTSDNSQESHSPKIKESLRSSHQYEKILPLDQVDEQLAEEASKNRDDSVANIKNQDLDGILQRAKEEKSEVTADQSDKEWRQDDLLQPHSIRNQKENQGVMLQQADEEMAHGSDEQLHENHLQQHLGMMPKTDEDNSEDNDRQDLRVRPHSIINNTKENQGVTLQADEGMDKQRFEDNLRQHLHVMPEINKDENDDDHHHEDLRLLSHLRKDQSDFSMMPESTKNKKSEVMDNGNVNEEQHQDLKQPHSRRNQNEDQVMTLQDPEEEKLKEMTDESDEERRKEILQKLLRKIHESKERRQENLRQLLRKSKQDLEAMSESAEDEEFEVMEDESDKYDDYNSRVWPHFRRNQKQGPGMVSQRPEDSKITEGDETKEEPHHVDSKWRRLYRNRVKAQEGSQETEISQEKPKRQYQPSRFRTKQDSQEEPKKPKKHSWKRKGNRHRKRKQNEKLPKTTESEETDPDQPSTHEKIFLPENLYDQISEHEDKINDQVQASIMGIETTDSVEKLIEDFEDGKLDEKDTETIQNLDDQKIDHLIEELDEAEHHPSDCEESLRRCQTECDCQQNTMEDVDKYEILKSFLTWIKEMHLDRVLTA